MTTAIKAPIIPYSMDVAPVSSRPNRRRISLIAGYAAESKPAQP